MDGYLDKRDVPSGREKLMTFCLKIKITLITFIINISLINCLIFLCSAIFCNIIIHGDLHVYFIQFGTSLVQVKMKFC